MSNSNQDERDEKHEDALKALHGLGDSDESEAEGAPQERHEEEADDVGPSSGGASGFVGMLAKEGAGASKNPVPQPEATPAKEGIPVIGRTDEIQMAREIQPVRPVTETATSPAAVARSGKGPKPAPAWYHAAVPVMYTLGSLLLLIGFWAIGAIVYMAVKRVTEPADVGYPFLEWSFDFEGVGSYSQGSRVMPWIMVVCLPVSLALGMMAGIMQRHIRADAARGIGPGAQR